MENDPINIRLLVDRILIEEIDHQQVSSGGIVLLTESAAGGPKLRYGIVRAVGPGRIAEGTGEPVPITVQIGDKIAFSDNFGPVFEIVVDGKQYLMLSSEISIFAILTEGENHAD